MASFLLFSILAFSGAMFLIFLRGDVAKGDNGEILRVSFRIGNYVLIRFPRMVFFILCICAAFCFLVIPAYLFIVNIYASESEYYLVSEFVNSGRFARMCLGGIFGVSFAVWTSRVYNSAPGEFSNFDRIFSVASVVVFVVGTTNITLEEIVRGFSLDVAGVKLSLPRAPETREQTPSYAVAPGRQDKQEVSADFGRSYALGFKVLYSVGSFIEADIERARQISGDGKDRSGNSNYSDLQEGELANLEKALKNYRENVRPALECIDELINISRQRDSHLDLLRQASFEVVGSYTRSLTDRDDNNKSSDQGDTGQNSSGIPNGNSNGVQNRRKYLEELADSADQWNTIVDAGGAPSEKRGRLKGCKGTIEKIRFEIGGDKTVTERPYLAIVIAGLMQLWGNGNEIPAVQMLGDWLSTYGKAPDSSHGMSVWYSLRIKSAQLILLNSYIERIGNPPSETIGGYLKLLDSMIETIEGMPGVMARYDVLIATAKRSDDPRQMFATTWYLSGTCKEKNLGVTNDSFDHVASGLLESLITLKLQYAHYAQQHRDFIGRFQRRARGIVEEISSSVEYSCAMEHTIKYTYEKRIQDYQDKEQKEMTEDTKIQLKENIREYVKQRYAVQTVDIIIAWAEMNNTIAYSLGQPGAGIKAEPGTKELADNRLRHSIAALLLAKEMLAPFESNSANDDPTAIAAGASLVSQKLDEINRHYEFARFRLQ